MSFCREVPWSSRNHIVRLSSEIWWVQVKVPTGLKVYVGVTLPSYYGLIHQPRYRNQKPLQHLPTSADTEYLLDAEFFYNTIIKLQCVDDIHSPVKWRVFFQKGKQWRRTTLISDSHSSYSANQPLQVGAYTLSAKSETKNDNFVLKHFLNEFFLFSQFFLQVQIHTFMIFLTKKNPTNILGDYWF